MFLLIFLFLIQLGESYLHKVLCTLLSLCIIGCDILFCNSWLTRAQCTQTRKFFRLGATANTKIKSLTNPRNMLDSMNIFMFLFYIVLFIATLCVFDALSIAQHMQRISRKYHIFTSKMTENFMAVPIVLRKFCYIYRLM